MPRARRKPSDVYHHGDLRAAILTVAEQLVRNEGALALSVRSVALRLGVSHAAVYHHFKDRNDMVASVAERGFEQLGAAMDAALRELDSNVQRMKSLGLSYVHFAAKHPQLYAVMFGPEAALRRTYPGLAGVAKQVFERIRTAVIAGQAEGWLVPGSAEEHSLVCWSAVHGLASLIVERQVGELELQDASTEALAELVVTRVFTGLGIRPS